MPAAIRWWATVAPAAESGNETIWVVRSRGCFTHRSSCAPPGATLGEAPGPALIHPRNNGSMARRVGHYARDLGVAPLEQMVRTMTSLPARVFGFEDRGEIRAGAFADIVVFDLARVADRATFDKPHELSDGFDWVIVNGQVARRDGTFTGARSGRVLKR